jgi:hypothetical protein
LIIFFILLYFQRFFSKNSSTCSIQAKYNQISRCFLQLPLYCPTYDPIYYLVFYLIYCMYNVYIIHITLVYCPNTMYLVSIYCKNLTPYTIHILILYVCYLLYTEGFFWTVCAWLCVDGLPRLFCLELSSFFLMYKLHRQASSETTSFKFLCSVLLRAPARAWKKDTKSEKEIEHRKQDYEVLVLRNPYCPLQSQKMFLVEASTNFSFAIVAKVNLDREWAEIAQHLFSLVC